MKKEEVALTVEATSTQVATVSSQVASFDAGFEGMGFEDASLNLLTSDMLGQLKDTECRAVLEGLSTIDIKGESKEFVKMKMVVNEEVTTFYAGQHKFRDVFARYDKGNGVAILFTFRGVGPIKGTAKIINIIDCLAKSL
jgi:hypothetical protein